ncbi:transposase [Sunxiuqinia sp. sy24]|uniref:transposase n=1 Tax=Sunxiuqinia sp. sy24 TaxID=3461495 RepID=UPI004045D1AB
MAQSLSKLFVHLIFHIKSGSVKIRGTENLKLYAYLGSVLKSNDSIPIIINGTEDHVHILCVMSKNISLAKLVEEIKRHSSRWIKTLNGYYELFAWQGGYGGFSVSPSVYDKTKRYIENQEEHHKRMSFKEEYLMFLKEYGIDFDERYLWKD